MKVKVTGFIDEVIELEDGLWEAAKAADMLEEVMLPKIEALSLEVVYVPVEDTEDGT